MDPVVCANCGETIGKLEVPRVYADQPVCQRCWQRLASQSTAVGYEPRRASPAKRRTPSPILIVGRVIFGALMLLGLWVAVRGKFGADEDERAIYAGINILWPSALIFLLTFVKRAF